MSTVFMHNTHTHRGSVGFSIYLKHYNNSLKESAWLDASACVCVCVLSIYDYRLIDERFGESEPTFDGHGQRDGSGS